MTEVFIVGAARTAIGTFTGSLKTVPAHALGTIVIKEALNRAGVRPEQVEEVIMGNVLMAGQAQGPGRQAAINAGIPVTSPAYTVNHICGSGLKSVALAYNQIMLKQSECMVAGGMENMSIAPHVASIRPGVKMGMVEFKDSMVFDALTDAFSTEHMGLTAERVAERKGISRQEQDEFALTSQNRAEAAWNSGRFDEEIVPVEIKQKKGEPIIFKKDEHFRPGTTIEGLAKLKPAFKKDGSVTAGNSSGINDGAAALVLASGEFVKQHNLKPLAKIISHATSGIEPEIMGLAPIEASKKALKMANWQISDLDRIELNEAFASQSIAVCKELNLDMNKTNVNGGAIALGHPVGASGARILVSLLYELKHCGGKKGLAGLCVGGGMGVAMLIEMV